MTGKLKFRQVYTVTRTLSEPMTLHEAKHDFLAVQDETGEYLYAGSGAEEKIEVHLEVRDVPNQRWIPVK